jgi:hypothetical protein
MPRRLALLAALALIACGPPPPPRKKAAPPPASARAKRPPPAPAPGETVKLDPCDEVACMMIDYQDECCKKLGKPPGAGGAPGKAVPASLTPEMIRGALAPVRGAVVACGDDRSAGRRVKVRVQVRPDGGAAVKVVSTDDARLGECVAGAVGRAKYPVTRSGGAFTQPYVF